VHLTGLDRFYWLSGFGAHLVLLSILLFCRRFRQIPVFTAFIAFNIARTCVLFLVQSHGSRLDYFDAYWALGAFDTLVELGVVFEMYFRTFRPLGRWPQDLRWALLGIALGIAVVAGCLTWLATPPARVWTQAIVIRGSFFSSVCMSGLLVAMIALSVRVGLPFDPYVQRVSQGFGAYSIVDLLIEAGHSLFGGGRDIRIYATLSHMRMTAYLGCVLYWIAMMWRSTPVQRRMPERIRGQLIELDRLTQIRLGGVRRRRWL
jgi:hypothetical protein